MAKKSTRREFEEDLTTEPRKVNKNPVEKQLEKKQLKSKWLIFSVLADSSENDHFVCETKIFEQFGSGDLKMDKNLK